MKNKPVSITINRVNNALFLVNRMLKLKKLIENNYQNCIVMCQKY